MRLAECTECKNEFRPVLQWTTGKWTPGTVKPLLWTTKQFSSVRKLQNTLDYHKFKEDVTRAIIANSALAYGSEALCRFSTPHLPPVWTVNLLRFHNGRNECHCVRLRCQRSW